MEYNLKRILICSVLILMAVVSFLFASRVAAAPENHAETINSIDEKVDTVFRLTASSTLASAGISAIPGDTATPIAAKLADFTEYFLLILCVLYAEKYLITIIGAGTFKVLIPVACLFLLIGMFWNPKMMKKLGVKIAVFGLAIFFTIPLSIRVSDMIYDTYRESIDNTITTAEEFTEKTAEISEAREDAGLLASVLNRLSESASSLSNKAAKILNNFVESLAVMIVTSCVIPLLVLVFFLWLIRIITGIDITANMRPYIGRHGENEK